MWSPHSVLLCLLQLPGHSLLKRLQREERGERKRLSLKESGIVQELMVSEGARQRGEERREIPREIRSG